MYNILEEASKICEDNHIEISFTSPGWIEEDKMQGLKLDTPSCGACLSNMAIAPNGEVIPCQSWLSSNSSLGNILNDNWTEIWDSNDCQTIRDRTVNLYNICQLKEFNK